MQFSNILALLATASTLAVSQYTVPVPFEISNLNIENVRHGTGG
jgi:hypothetical protein